MSTAAAPTPLRVPGLLGAVTSTDHKRIGLNLGICSLGFFLLGGVFALLMRARLAQPNEHLVSDDTYNALFTMHGSTMIYLFVTPMAIALALYLVPLQIGAVSVAAPRAALAGFWVWLSGGLIMQAGWFTGTGPGRDGWSAYAPLSNGLNTPGVGQDLWVIAVILAAGGMLVMSASVVGTVARRRAPGMSLRMPVFTWTALVSVLMVVGAFPVLIVTMALLYVNRHGGHIYDGFNGVIDYQDLFWFFGHPVVYVMFFPYLGAAAEAIAVSAHKRWFGYIAFVASMMLFAALSMSVWAHHMFVTGGVTNQYFAFTSTALAIPAGVEYFDTLATLIGGSIVLRTSMLFALDVLRSVPDRRSQRCVRRLAGARLPGVRVVLRRRPLPLHAVRRQHLRLLRRRLPLVPEGHGRDAARAAREAPAGRDGDRHQHDVLPDVLPRSGRDAAPDLSLPDAPELGDAKPDRDDRRRDHRPRGADVYRQRMDLAAGARAGRRRPVARTHARVGDNVAAPAFQLHPTATADPLLRTVTRPA